MHRRIAPGIRWIEECGPDRTEISAAARARGETWSPAGVPLHIPQNAYLFLGDRTLLFDTLSPAAGEHVLEELASALEGRDLDFLVISHPDVPHAGNTARILRRYPGCTLVAPAVGELHELYRLEEAMKVGPGDRIDLGGPVVQFAEATFLDAAASLWLIETTTNTLFSVDWLGFPHLDGECLRCTDELDAPVEIARLTEFHSRVLFWFQYVDVAKVQAEIDRLARDVAPDIVAPAHGLVIRDRVPAYFDLMKEVVARVAEAGRVGVL